MKRISLLISVVAFAGWFSPASRASLLSDYPFDNDATNLVDATTSGTLMNGAAITNDSAIGGGALSLDGVGDYVDLTVNGYPNATAGRFTGSATFWMKAGTSGNVGGSDILGSAGALNDFELVYFYSGSGTTGQLGFWCRPGSVDHRFVPSSSSTNMSDSIWRQYTVTWNMSTGGSGTGSAEWYRDGVLINGVTGQGTWTTNDTMNSWVPRPMTIGKGVDYGYFTGKLDDVAVWTTKLDATAARALYEVGKDLDYNAKDVDVLFTIFAGGPGSSGDTSDGTTWCYTAGLTGTEGTVVNGGTAVILDGSGNGVTSVAAVAGTVITIK